MTTFQIIELFAFCMGGYFIQRALEGVRANAKLMKEVIEKLNNQAKAVKEMADGFVTIKDALVKEIYPNMDYFQEHIKSLAKEHNDVVKFITGAVENGKKETKKEKKCKK